MLLLAILLSVPLAWITAVFSLPNYLFLVFSVVPTALSIYVVQRQRIQQRIIDLGNSSEIEQQGTLRENQSYQTINSIWSQIRHLASKREANWKQAYQSIKHVERNKLNLLKKEEKILDKLISWWSRGSVSKTREQVHELHGRLNELHSQLNNTEAIMGETKDKINKAVQRLMQRASVLKKEKQQWEELNHQLRETEKKITQTLWARAESEFHWRWVRNFEYSYAQKRTYVLNWLESRISYPLNTSKMERLNMLIKEKGKLKCTNGDAPYSVNQTTQRRQPHVQPTVVSQSSINTLRDL